MANVLQYKTLAETTINDAGGISNVDLSVTVTDGSKFPALGDFYCLIESELVKVTARVVNVLTIVRAQEGTTAASHADGLPIMAVITALSVEGLFKRHTPDFRSSPLVAADFSQVNLGTASISDEDGIITVRAPITAGAQARLFLKTLPAAPYVLTMSGWFWAPGGNFCSGGLVLRDSGAQSITGLLVRQNTQYVAEKWTNSTTQGAGYATGAGSWKDAGRPVYLRIEDNNTNRIYSISQDGKIWLVVHTVTRLDFLTPDQYGIMVNPDGSGSDRFLTVYDIKVS